MITIFQLAIISCCAVSGIIWLKQKQEFVQLFSIPQFAVLQEENLAKHHAVEILDMKNEVVRAVYYEVRNESKELYSTVIFKNLQIFNNSLYYNIVNI